MFSSSGALGGSAEHPEQGEVGGRRGGGQGEPTQPLQGGGGQVGVLVLELPIQRQPPLLPVVGKEGGQGVDFAECRARGHHITEDDSHHQPEPQLLTAPTAPQATPDISILAW